MIDITQFLGWSGLVLLLLGVFLLYSRKSIRNKLSPTSKDWLTWLFINPGPSSFDVPTAWNTFDNIKPIGYICVATGIIFLFIAAIDFFNFYHLL